METPAWANDLDTGLGALIAELEAAESDETGLGKKPNWSAIKAKAATIKAHVASALHDFTQQNGKLHNAAKYIDRLQEQLGQLKQQAQQQQQQPMQAPQPWTGMAPRPGVGAAGQTVYLSAGATAGIAAGALLIGAVGGFATKAIIDANKDKKKLAADEESKKKALKPASEEAREGEEETEAVRSHKGGRR
jgi:hypothetical protein